MSKVFDFSNIAKDKSFVGREDEIKRLSSDFVFLTNTAVIAPSGWGKSSFVCMAAQVAMHKEKSLRFCRVPLENIRNDERFYELLVQEVLKAVSVGSEHVLDLVRTHFSSVYPKISFKSDKLDSLCVDFDWEEVRRNQDEILDFPFRIAKSMGLKLVVCFDDFQSVTLFSDPYSLLDRLKVRWPKHEGVAYCVSTSAMSVVEKFLKSTPIFYRFGEVFNLGKIKRTEMVKWVRERFADSAKYIDNEIAGQILDLVGEHPFYVQQLAHLVWLGSAVVCSQEVVAQAHETMVDQMGLVFENLTSSLTAQQLCYLHAVLAGETIISTAEVLHRHHITSATSASRSKTALLERGIVCSSGGKIVFADPVYAYWLKHRYFG